MLYHCIIVSLKKHQTEKVESCALAYLMFFSINTIGVQENLLKHLVYHIALGLYSGVPLDVLAEMYHQTPAH